MKWRGRLFFKYIVLFVGLVAGALVLNGALDLYFVDRENRVTLAAVQREKAQAAAHEVGQFIQEIERQIGWTTHPQWPQMSLEQRQFDFGRLLKQVPAIAELTSIDSQGREQMLISRLNINVIGSNADRSHEPYFTNAVAKRLYFGPVHFRKDSEPHMTMAVAGIGRSPAVTVAEVNLKLILDVITQVKVGDGGYAYVVDINGRLIAHPDIALVLRNTDLGRLPQVAAARATSSPAVTVLDQSVENWRGEAVRAAYAPIPALGWYVFVELPESEARRPLYDAATRTGILLLLGILIAAFAAALLARRMLVPIRALQEGAARIGAGDLDRRLDIKTGDELEALADRFNTMAGQLRQSYAELEAKVAERTNELAAALEQQTATAEVLTVISRSTANLQPVFDTIVKTAARLCHAESATLIRVMPDGSNQSVAAIGVSEPVRVFQLANPLQPDRGSVVGRTLIDRKIVHIVDVLSDPDFTALDRQKVTGMRTCLGVPLMHSSQVLGVIFLYRTDVEPFTDKQIELVATFADQAVIAIENTRLFEEIQARTEELREALEFQTATSDVLKQMGRFSADLAPVLDTVTTTAARLCQADLAFVFLLKGGLFHLAAANRVSAEFVYYLRANPFPIDRGTTSGRVALAKSTVHIHDVGADRDYTMDQSRGIGQMRTSLGVPLLRDGEVVGTIVLARSIVKPFAQNQIDLITTFADQAAIAIENTRLFEEVQARTGDLTEALEYQTATSDVLKQMGRLNFDLTPVLQTVVGTAARLCEAERAYILLLGDDKKYHLAAANQVEGAFAEYLKHNPLAIDRGTVTGRVVLEKRTVQIADVSSDPEYTLRESTDLGRQRTSLGVPLLREGSVIGVIVLARDVVKPFALRQIDLVTTFADQAVIAIENVRLFRELEEKNKQLAIASQHKSQFLANMSHELRTPLNAILGYSEMMVDGLYGEMGDKAKGVLERVLTNGKHLLGLINDVLDLSKIEAGQLKLAIDDFRLADVVNAVVAATESLAKAKGLALHAHIGPALPVGRGDSRRLTQVLLNLVGNAIKFTDQGSVEIRASHQDGNFEVAVVDTGPGIPPEHQARVFDEFQQVDTSSTRKKGGTGLGLSISRKFVELHGGRITVDSKVGVGSTFHVVWPTIAQPSGETP